MVSWDGHLDKKYGKTGSPARMEFGTTSQTFILRKLLKEKMGKAKLTQTQMAEKTETKKVTLQELKMGKLIINFPLFTG